MTNLLTRCLMGRAKFTVISSEEFGLVASGKFWSVMSI